MPPTDMKRSVTFSATTLSSPSASPRKRMSASFVTASTSDMSFFHGSTRLHTSSFDSSRFGMMESFRHGKSSYNTSARSVFSQASYGSDWYSDYEADASGDFSYTDFETDYRVPTGFFGHDHKSSQVRGSSAESIDSNDILAEFKKKKKKKQQNKRSSFNPYHSRRHNRSIREHWILEDSEDSSHDLTGAEAFTPSMERQNGVRNLVLLEQDKEESSMSLTSSQHTTETSEKKKKFGHRLNKKKIGKLFPLGQKKERRISEELSYLPSA